MIQYTLEERDGWLYVAATEPDWDQPLLRTLAYPTGRRARDSAPYAVTLPVPLARFGETYCTASMNSLCYRLREGGQTRPEWSREAPIPPPHTRLRPVRYRFGRWEVQTKKGWGGA